MSPCLYHKYASPGGRLAECCRKIDKEVRVSSGGLVKATVVEQPGVRLSALLVDNLPGEQDLCNKPECNTCKSGTTERLSCHRKTLGGMVYKCCCLTCKERGSRRGRRGLPSTMETPAGAWWRLKEHFNGQAVNKEDYALLKHQELFHTGEEFCKFEFRAEKFFREPVMHPIYEGVFINRSASTPGYLMNSRAKYDQGQVACLGIAQGSRLLLNLNPFYFFVCRGFILCLLGQVFMVIDHRFMFSHLIRSR